MPSALQLTRSGSVTLDTDLDQLRREFQTHHCVKLEALLAPALLASIQRQIERGTFHEFAHGSLATELRLATGTGTGLLHLVVNDPTLFGLVERVSGCAHIRSFVGRVYRRASGRGHFDGWHGDQTDPGRLVGMSINLSTETYLGGVFEIRDVHTRRVLGSLANVGFGDAILFRLSDDLEHRVGDVRGAFPKTAFAGWFLDHADPLDAIHRHRRA